MARYELDVYYTDRPTEFYTFYSKDELIIELRELLKNPRIEDTGYRVIK
jgi:hypothetical protein